MGISNQQGSVMMMKSSVKMYGLLLCFILALTWPFTGAVEKWNIEAQEPFKSSYPAKNRWFGFKWCTGKDGCCKKGEGDCDKNDDCCDGLSCDSIGAGNDKCTDEKIDMTCPDGSKISILKGYANNKDFLKKQCSSFWPDDECECTTPKYPLAMHAFGRFIGSCCLHDNCYMVCGKSKEQCDKEFYDHLEAQCTTGLCKSTIRFAAKAVMGMKAAQHSYDVSQKECKPLNGKSSSCTGKSCTVTNIIIS